jgi:riboflavin kinase
MKDIIILLELAQAGAHTAPRKISSRELASRLDTSQQTTARWLIDLEKRGLITRIPSARGQSVQLTKAGVSILRSVHRRLNSIFGARQQAIKLLGRVVSGLGEGSYYMRQYGYRRQFKRTLGFNPYPGTFDLKLSGESIELKCILDSSLGKRIEGFKTHERTFGPVKYFLAKLHGMRVAIVLPTRSTHTDIIELIAAKNIRKALKLKDGDRVEVEVEI